MSQHFQEHHSRSLGRSRDSLTNSIVSLRSAVDRMTGDDWIDATTLLNELVDDIGPRLARLREAANARLDEHHTRPDFEAMRTGRVPFPDERAAVVPTPPSGPGPPPAPPAAGFPNAHVGAVLVAHHGSIDAAMMAYPPDSAEFDHVQAYRYVMTGKRPKGWIPPTVGTEEPE